jgi:hypothetical protein
MKIMGLTVVSDISERRARDVQPQSVFFAAGRGIEAVVMTVFAAIGWLVGAIFGVAVNCALSLEYGFRAGARLPQRQIVSDEPPPEG